tara:strand:+ start:36 stop:329 length:294 start_codon:yes stop_codon:yes gene_type:complete
MKIYFNKNLLKPLTLVIFLISFVSLKGEFLNAEYLSEELQIDSSTKTEENSSAIPTNPFEIVEMIRRYNSMNDATNPSDAIDDALKSFNNLEEEKNF